MAQTASDIAESAGGVFHRRLEEKKREFIELAQTYTESAAHKLSDEIEKKVGSMVDVLPGGTNVKPLLTSGFQILLAAALTGLLRPSAR